MVGNRAFSIIQSRYKLHRLYQAKKELRVAAIKHPISDDAAMILMECIEQKIDKLKNQINKLEDD